MTDSIKEKDWKKVRINVRKFSVIAIGTDEWGEPNVVPIWAPLGKHARIHYPTYFPTVEFFMKFREEHWINLRIAVDNELAFIEHLKHTEKMNNEYKTKIETYQEAIERLAQEDPEKVEKALKEIEKEAS